MTCAIVAKKDDKVILGVDSLISFPYTKRHFSDNVKVDKVKNVYITTSGSARAMQKMVTILKNSEDNRLIRELYNNSRDFIEAYIECFIELAEANIKENEFSNNFILAYKNFVFYIDAEFAVFEIHDFQAIGSGAEVASGVYLAIEKSKMSLDKKILKCLRISERINPGVESPFVIVDTLNEKEVIYKK